MNMKRRLVRDVFSGMVKMYSSSYDLNLVSEFLEKFMAERNAETLVLFLD